MIRHTRLPDTGRLLDIGCGNGAFLRAFARAMPRWTLVGTELSDATRAIVESIPGVEGLHVGSLDDLTGQFDLIALVHVLEHVSRPLDLLAVVSSKVKADGVVFVEVPDVPLNPFDLVIADHISHFTPATATALLESAGYVVSTSSRSWAVKEISVLARHATGVRERPRGHLEGEVIDSLHWLLAVADAARAASARAAPSFGLFGSSNAAAWLAQEVNCGMRFFVDEDPQRQQDRKSVV